MRAFCAQGYGPTAGAALSEHVNIDKVPPALWNICSPPRVIAASYRPLHATIRVSAERSLSRAACLVRKRKHSGGSHSFQVAFTGSTEVGKIIAAAAAKNIKPVTLELGGCADPWRLSSNNFTNSDAAIHLHLRLCAAPCAWQQVNRRE